MEIIPHRGDKRYTPENTMAAFQSAYSYPIEGIELDLQLTKDGVPIVIHDSTLDRTTNGSGQVKNFFFREIKELDAGSWFKEVPTFKY